VLDAPIDHVAIVVADLEAAIALYTETLGFSLVYREIVADQGVEAVGGHQGVEVLAECFDVGRCERRFLMREAAKNFRREHEVGIR